jgi:transposase-like protein
VTPVDGHRFTDDERREIVRMADQVSPAYAAAEFGVKPATIRQWRRRLGISHAPEKLERLNVGIQVQALSWELRARTMGNEAGEVAETYLGMIAEMGDSGAWWMMSHAAQAARVFATLVNSAQLLTGGATTRPDLDGDKLKAESRQLLAQLREMERGPA